MVLSNINQQGNKKMEEIDLYLLDFNERKCAVCGKIKTETFKNKVLGIGKNGKKVEQTVYTCVGSCQYKLFSAQTICAKLIDNVNRE